MPDPRDPTAAANSPETPTNDSRRIGLEDAYALKGTEDARALYDAWADSYDSGFAKAHDYNTPDVIAEIYADHATDPAAPVLDIGAGTGLVARVKTRVTLRLQRARREISGVRDAPGRVAPLSSDPGH